MPICKKCGISFPNIIKVDGKTHNMCKRKFCLDCSPFGKHNTKNLIKEKTNIIEQCVCQVCKKEYIYQRGSGCSKNKCSSCWVKRRYIRIKTKLILIMGGCCSMCGYKKNYAALSFHHLDPNIKLLNLDARSLQSHSWKVIMEETQKCILLCANCHQELHNPQCEINPEQVDLSKLEKNIVYSNFCYDCGKEIDNNSIRCQKCFNDFRISQDNSKIDWPTTTELLKLLETNSYLSLGKTLGVSDNAIRKRIRTHSI